MAVSHDDLRLAEADQRKLYELIWKRTLASQMAAARMERPVVDIGSADGQISLRANGQVLLFDGFLRVYDEGRDDEDEDEGRLPQIMAGGTAAPPKGAGGAAGQKQGGQGGKEEFDLIDRAVS